MRRKGDDTSRYRTRRDWILAEIILGIVSCATGFTGIAGGIVSHALQETAANTPWFLFFFGSGSGLILVAVAERFCRQGNCGRVVLVRFSCLRFAMHFINMLAWASAFIWLQFTEVFVASIYFESLPLAIVNFIGLVEHAKARWLIPERAGTTSMLRAGVEYLQRSR